MNKLTQTEFDAMERDELGFLHIPPETDCSDVDVNGAKKVVFGDGCTLGDCCNLGNDCTLGDGCKLGDCCTLGEFCDIRATFEGGNVKNGLFFTVGNIGSEHRTAYFYINEDGALFVRAGCWFSALDDFKARVRDIHGGTLYETQYMAACRYAEAVLPEMLEEADERATR